MKKLLLVLAVMLMTVPAMAAVSISGADAGNGVGAISYTSTGVLPRAFALDITVDNGAVITGVDTAGAQPFNIYMGTIQIAADGTVTDAGTPVAPATDPGALTGIGTAGITVEMGSLYDATVSPNPAKPAAAGLLIKVSVDKACTVTVASNTTRGNVVLEDATIAAMTTINFPVGSPIPDICYGDVYPAGGDGWVTVDDLYQMLNDLSATAPDFYFEVGPTQIAYDVYPTGGGDGWCTVDDLYQLLNDLSATSPDFYYQCQ